MAVDATATPASLHLSGERIARYPHGAPHGASCPICTALLPCCLSSHAARLRHKERERDSVTGWMRASVNRPHAVDGRLGTKAIQSFLSFSLFLIKQTMYYLTIQGLFSAYHAVMCHLLFEKFQKDFNSFNMSSRTFFSFCHIDLAHFDWYAFC